jgi:hypothetical protein
VTCWIKVFCAVDYVFLDHTYLDASSLRHRANGNVLHRLTNKQSKIDGQVFAACTFDPYPHDWFFNLLELFSFVWDEQHNSRVM